MASRLPVVLPSAGGVLSYANPTNSWLAEPNGESFASCAPGHTQPLSGDWSTLRTQHESQDVHIDPHTARTHWRGESMDYGLAIDVLLGKERRAADTG
jgi:hypothetical protein